MTSANRLMLKTALPPLLGLALGIDSLHCPVLGAELQAKSSITSVTVYPSGAEITRSVAIDLAVGEHTVIILVPGEQRRESLRVSGTSPNDVSISSVDVRTLPLETGSDDPARENIEREIERLGDERATLDRAVADTEFSYELITTLAQRRLQPQGKDVEPSLPPPAELSALLDLVNGRLAEISKTTLDARLRQRAIDRRVDELKHRLTEMMPRTGTQSQVSIHVVVARPVLTNLRVTYRLAEASWQAIYDARLDTGENGKPARLTLVHNAEVVQETAEPWQDVQLILSTARPTGATTPPAIGAQEIHSFTELSGSSHKPEVQSAATVAGFQAFYEISGRVTVDNTNTSKLVTIATDELPATLSLKAVPKLDLTAYLLAQSKSVAATSLLPGPVMLYRDGVFVGESKLPVLSPGDTFEIGFGADEFVTIERREVSHKSGETGLISSAFVAEQSFLTVIASRHEVAIPITILDQVPYASDDRIRVELLPDSALPTSKDVNGKRGVYAWSLEAVPNSRTEVRFGFRVIWPKDMR